MGINSLANIVLRFPGIADGGPRYTDEKYLGQYWVNLGVILREAKSLGHAPDNIKVKIAIAYRNLPRVKFGKDFQKTIYASGHRGAGLFATESPYKVWVPSAVVARALHEVIAPEAAKEEPGDSVDPEDDPEELDRYLNREADGFEARYSKQGWASVTVSPDMANELWRRIQRRLDGRYSYKSITGNTGQHQIVVYSTTYWRYLPGVRVALLTQTVIDTVDGGSMCFMPV